MHTDTVHRTMKVIVGAVFAAAASAAAAMAPAQVFGTVVDGVSGAIVPKATVVLRRSGATDRIPSQRQITDDRGRFAFGSVSAGRYEVQARKTGYMSGWWGLEGPRDVSISPLDVRDGEQREVRLTLWPYASIAGIVEDSRGDAVVGAALRILRRSQAGWTAARSNVKTDERGVFVVGQLVPGDYVLLLAEPPEVADSVFYPSAHSIGGAMIVRLESGENRTGINFRRQEPTRRFLLAGRVEGASAGLAVHLRPNTEDEVVSKFLENVAYTDSAGRFTFRAVPAGQFQIIAWQIPKMPSGVPLLEGQGEAFSLSNLPNAGAPLMNPPLAPTMVAEDSIEISRNTENLVLKLRPGARFGGRIRFDDSSSPPDQVRWASLLIVVRPVRPNVQSVPLTMVASDGTFRSVGLPPGEYAVGVFCYPACGSLNGWDVVSVRNQTEELVGRRIPLDDADVSLTITLSNRKPRLSGLVTAPSGQPQASTHVLIVPTNRTLWRDAAPLPAFAWIIHTTTDDKGAYAASVLPGTYFVTTSRVLPDLWWTPEVLETLVARGSKVDLRLGEHKHVSIVGAK